MHRFWAAILYLLSLEATLGSVRAYAASPWLDPPLQLRTIIDQQENLRDRAGGWGDAAEWFKKELREFQDDLRTTRILDEARASRLRVRQLMQQKGTLKNGYVFSIRIDEFNDDLENKILVGPIYEGSGRTREAALAQSQSEIGIHASFSGNWPRTGSIRYYFVVSATGDLDGPFLRPETYNQPALYEQEPLPFEQDLRRNVVQKMRAARDEAARKVREEAERKAREEAEAKARAEAEARARQASASGSPAGGGASPESKTVVLDPPANLITPQDIFMNGSGFADVQGIGRADLCVLVFVRAGQKALDDRTVGHDGTIPICFPVRKGKLLSDARFWIHAGDARQGSRDADSLEVDPGIPGTRAWVDVDGDGRADFCRVIRPKFDQPEYRLACNLSKKGMLEPASLSEPIRFTDLRLGRWTKMASGKYEYCHLLGFGMVNARTLDAPLDAAMSRALASYRDFVGQKSDKDFVSIEKADLATIPTDADMLTECTGWEADTLRTYTTWIH